MADANGTANHLADELSKMSIQDIQGKYRAVRIGRQSEHGLLDATVDIDHPVDLLYAIECDQRIADVVLELEWMPGDRETYLTIHRDPAWDPAWHGTPQSKLNLANLQTHPLHMVNLELTNDEKLRGKGEIDAGGHSAIFAIILCKLPNLSSLGLTDGCYQYLEYLNKVFRQTSTQPNSTILSKLVKAYVSHNDTEGGEQVEVLDELVLVPSLKKLECHMLGDGDNDYHCLQTKTGDTRTSNIEEVDISWSILTPIDIAEFLKPLVKLKKLDYENYHPDWSTSQGFPGELEDAREEFQDAIGDMLEQRDLIWKMNCEEMVIRKKDLVSEIEDFNADISGPVKTTHTVEIMPDGTERHTRTFG